MRLIFDRYRLYLINKEFLISSIVGILALTVSLFVNYYAGTYAQESVSNSVTDIILSNTRVYDLDHIFTYGSIILVIFIGILSAIKPQRIPFTSKSIALFVIIRAIFISLTHIGEFPNRVIIDSTSFINHFTFGGDLFFSGHTGLPFLMALVYWENKYFRSIFILSSVIFGVSVLLSHLHYTIDVLSAFFISYTIYHIATKLFKKDMELFHKS